MIQLTNLSLPERSLYENMIRQQLNNLTSLYRALMPKSTINYKVKKNGEFGYFCYYNIFPLIEFIQQNKSRSIVDLGSGAGILMKVLQDNTNIKTTGYENQKKLVEVANRLGVKTFQKNILTLKKEDIENFDIIYFWEPIYDAKKAKKFVDNLIKILSPNQTIFYIEAAAIGTFLRGDQRIIELPRTSEFHMFKLKE